MKSIHRSPLVIVAALLLLLGLLVTITFVNTGSGPHPAMQEATKTTLKGTRAELAIFMKDNGRYPTTEEGLAALVGPNGKHSHMDAWGTDIRYRVFNNKPIVDSAGPDRAFDTADDIK